MREQPVLYQRNAKSPGEKRKRGWLFWLLVVGVPLAVLIYIGAVAGFGYLYVSSSKELPVSNADWDVVIDAHDVAEWLPDLEVSTTEGRLQKLRYLDRSYEITYEYESADSELFVSSSLSIERKITDALAGYLPLWAATLAGFKIGGGNGLEVETLEDFFEWGDQSKIGLIRNQGEPFGHLFIARQDKRVVFLLLSGIYFDDAQMWAEFVTPTLDRVSRYSAE